jgi:hypothetical protein
LVFVSVHHSGALHLMFWVADWPSTSPSSLPELSVLLLVVDQTGLAPAHFMRASALALEAIYLLMERCFWNSSHRRPEIF